MPSLLVNPSVIPWPTCHGLDIPGATSSLKHVSDLI